MARSTKLIAALKQELRARGISYRALAGQLGISESAVKHMFSVGNFSLRRLDEVCATLGMEVSDLAQLADSGERRLDRLTLENERTLVSDMKLLLVAYCVMNYWTAGEILRRYRLDEPELVRCLARLDRMKMIELKAGNRVRLLLSNNFSWHENGPIERFFREQVQSRFLNSSFTREDELRLVKNGDITHASRIQLAERLLAVGDLFDEVTRDERKLPHASKEGTTMVLAIRKWEFLAFRKLERARE